jgi:hypothetical protein
MKNVPRDHHYVPQFFLRNFAVDPEAKKITTVSKHGPIAVWSQRSIERMGFERDLYVHLDHGIPISVESAINARIENPISKSDAWAKITSGRADTLDRSDKPILYALMRHLEVRTPHFMAMAGELANLAAKPDAIPFTEEERAMYATMRANPDLAKAHLNAMSATLAWSASAYRGAALAIFRSPIPLRSSSAPAMVTGAPAHPALRLDLPGMQPYQLMLTLNKTTIASLVIGDFDDAFCNIEVDIDVARGFNRHFVMQFAFFDHVRHLITDRHELSKDMTWAHFDMTEETERKITFKKRS